MTERSERSSVATPADVATALAEQGYLPDVGIATAVFLSMSLKRLLKVRFNVSVSTSVPVTKPTPSTMASAAQPSSSSASCQPKRPISQLYTGTMRNWPNEPAAAVTPMAHERFSGATLRPSTP